MSLNRIKFIDLFAGIGGFRFAANEIFPKYGLIPECVFSSEIDKYAQESYESNFGDKPFGDITKINANSIPDHDILFAGFPCQPFSIIGKKLGFEDTRGTLFFDIARILKEKQPPFFVLENVKLLATHNEGKTFKRIIEVLEALNYNVNAAILNALDFGLPQKRERVIIIGSKADIPWMWPQKVSKFKPLSAILEKNVDSRHYSSKMIQDKRKAKHTSRYDLAIWHENKAGNVTSYPYSCALRAGASYNYLLVNGERRLTSREMLRLQGFPDSFKIVVSEAQVRKQAGNAVPVNIIRAVLDRLTPHIQNCCFGMNAAVNEPGRGLKSQINNIIIHEEPKASYGKPIYSTL